VRRLLIIFPEEKNIREKKGEKMELF